MNFEKKEIRHYEKENALKLYEQYKSIGGNSYIEEVVSEIKTWKEIF